MYVYWPLLKVCFCILVHGNALSDKTLVLIRSSYVRSYQNCPVFRVGKMFYTHYKPITLQGQQTA